MSHDGELFRGLAALTDALEAAGNRTDDDPANDAKAAKLLDENETNIRAVIRYAATMLGRLR